MPFVQIFNIGDKRGICPAFAWREDHLSGHRSNVCHCYWFCVMCDFCRAFRQRIRVISIEMVSYTASDVFLLPTGFRKYLEIL